MNAQDIVQKVQNGSAPMSATETRKILDAMRSEAETHLNAVLVGVLMHHKTHTLAEELEVVIGDAEATAETMVTRFNKLQQALEAADLAVRKAKADKIMLPGSAPRSDLAKSDQAIRKAERALQTAQNNLKTAKGIAEQRQRELDNLRTVHRALVAVGLPDLTPIRVLLDAAR